MCIGIFTKPVHVLIRTNTGTLIFNKSILCNHREYIPTPTATFSSKLSLAHTRTEKKKKKKKKGKKKMADFVGTGGNDESDDDFAMPDDESDETTLVDDATTEVDEDEDDDDSSDFTSRGGGGGGENEERRRAQKQQTTSRSSSSSSSYYAERRKLMVQQLKETEPKKLVLGALSVLCCIKLLQTVSQRLFGVNQPGRGLKHRCNRCAKKDARVKCNRCKKAWYCSKECWKAAIKLEICECC